MAEKFEIFTLTEKDFSEILEMEKIIYLEALRQGQALLEDIKKGNGLEYSVIIPGIAYLVAVDKEDSTVYLEDIAVMPEAQRQGIGWKMAKNLIKKLQNKAEGEGKSVLLSMHLREASQKLFEKHKADLEKMGAKIIKEEFLPAYYKNGENAIYRIYKIGF